MKKRDAEGEGEGKRGEGTSPLTPTSLLFLAVFLRAHYLNA